MTTIAPGAGIGRGRDRAGLPRQDGRTGRRAEVNAVMPAVLLGQRVDAAAVGIGDLALIRQRIQPAAGIGRAGGIAAGAFVVILAVERGDAFGLFLGQGRIVGRLGLGDLLRKARPRPPCSACSRRSFLHTPPASSVRSVSCSARWASDPAPAGRAPDASRRALPSAARARHARPRSVRKRLSSYPSSVGRPWRSPG